MELTDKQTARLQQLTGIKQKVLKIFFNKFGEVDGVETKNLRKSYLWQLISGDARSISNEKKFTFFVNNLKVRRPEDIVIHGKKLIEISPELFDNESI